MAVRIERVAPGSPAAEAGLRGGMVLCSLNGHAVNDGLDYEFHSAAASLDILARDADGAGHRLRVEKPEYAPLGCEFSSYLIDAQHHCKNKCVFCFIDQLPKGLREPLYFKDDDERLGFLFGNYITLTNLTEQDVQRIIEMRISPVNISVHTADAALRVEMMQNPKAGEVLAIIPRLAAAGIAMNFQLVLVPGLNDGEQLRHSIRWLAGFAPATQSIAAVPVGLTRHRHGLPALSNYTAQSAAAQLTIMLAEGDALLEKNGVRLIYPSDEWFLLAGRPVPPADFYDDFPQLENGVGMWRLAHDEFCDALDGLDDGVAAVLDAEADLVVGTLAAPLWQALAERLGVKCPGVRLFVHPVENDFFGRSITVTGLITGGDIIKQLGGKLRTGRLLLPDSTLRAEGDVMLDGTTPDALAQALGVQVQVVPRDGGALLGMLLDGKNG